MIQMKNSHTFTFFILVGLLTVNFSVAYASDAHPYPINFTQPDSSTVEIIMMGDEYLRWAETIDGYSILFDNSGTYVYAYLDANGNMIPSAIKAKNISERSLSDSLFLNSINKHLFFSQEQQTNYRPKLIKSNTQITEFFPTSGNRKLICILIGFTDKPFTKTKTNFENLFNQSGYNFDSATGSFNQYYLENSYNQLNVTTTVAGPYTASNTSAYYGTNTPSQDNGLRELFDEALALADKDIDFSNFDTDNDGIVDGVYIIYAGSGEESGGGANTIYAQAWRFSADGSADGKTTVRAAFSSELNFTTTSITGIGTICHEFGHLLGALDFYDTDHGTGGQYDGTGRWDVMAKGRTNNYLKTPAHHNVYTKTKVFGWANYTTISNTGSFTLNNAAENSNSFYRVNTATDNEYFLIENRQLVKFDKSLPGHGMIIYHVDENYINTTGNGINAGIHQGMYPVCASATANPTTSYGNINSDGCPFPGSSGKSSFDDSTMPSSLSWSGLSTNKPITNIIENTISKTVSFNFMTINGVNGVKNNNSFAFPNPCNTQLTLLSNNNNRKTQYTLTNCLGQTVASGEYFTSETIDVSHLQSGTYILKDITSNFVQKVFIE